MEKNRILLIESETKTEAQVREALPGYDFTVLSALDELASLADKKAPALAIIDLDRRSSDGLQFFNGIHRLFPRVGVILLSAANDIPLAVRMTKLGAADFVKKPFTPDQLRRSIDRALSLPKAELLAPAQAAWLKGESAAINKMYGEIREALDNSRNIILFGEPGIDKAAAVQYLHANSLRNKRKLRNIDLDAFRRENMEALFWATIQEVMAEPEIVTGRSEEDLCGILYLNKFDDLDPNFKASILNFFIKRPGKLDREITVVIGLSERKAVKTEKIKEYSWIEIPPLRERKEDLPQLLSYYIKYYAEKHNKPVRGIAVGLLEMLSAYAFPGNYIEMESMIDQAVLRSGSNLIDLSDLPLAFRQILDISLNQLARSGRLNLNQAKKEFEKELFSILLAKSGGDIAAVARYIDVPRTTLAQRIDELGLTVEQEKNPQGD